MEKIENEGQPCRGRVWAIIIPINGVKGACYESRFFFFPVWIIIQEFLAERPYVQRIFISRAKTHIFFTNICPCSVEQGWFEWHSLSVTTWRITCEITDQPQTRHHSTRHLIRADVIKVSMIPKGCIPNKEAVIAVLFMVEVGLAFSLRHMQP